MVSPGLRHAEEQVLLNGSQSPSDGDSVSPDSPTKLRRDRSKRIYVHDDDDDDDAAALHASLARTIRIEYMRWLEITGDHQAVILHRFFAEQLPGVRINPDDRVFRRCWALIGNWTKTFQNVALNRFGDHMQAIAESNALFAGADANTRRNFLATQYTPETLGELLPFADGIINFPTSAKNPLVNRFMKNMYIHIGDISFQCLHKPDRNIACKLWRSFAFEKEWQELQTTDFACKIPKPLGAKKREKRVKKGVQDLVDDFSFFK